MYSYEGRLRAVQPCIKLGKRVGLTIRQLGYPTENALKTCYRDHEQRRDLPPRYVRQSRYSLAHKDRAVEHQPQQGRCIAKTIKSLGYPSRSLLPFAAVARIMGESACRCMEVCNRYVEMALGLADFSGVTALAIDVTSRARGHA